MEKTQWVVSFFKFYNVSTKVLNKNTHILVLNQGADLNIYTSTKILINTYLKIKNIIKKEIFAFLEFRSLKEGIYIAEWHE